MTAIATPSRSTVMGLFVLNVQQHEQADEPDNGITIHQVTRRLRSYSTTADVDGRGVRQVLDELTADGRLEYLGGQGNNRRYRWNRR